MWHTLTFKISFTPNVKRQLVPRDQVSPNLRFSVSYSVLTYVAGSFWFFWSFVVRKVGVSSQTRNDGGRGEGKNLVRLWFIFAPTCPLLNVPKTKKTTTTTPKKKKNTRKPPACTKTQFLFLHKNYFRQFFSHFQST